MTIVLHKDRGKYVARVKDSGMFGIILANLPTGESTTRKFAILKLRELLEIELDVNRHLFDEYTVNQYLDALYATTCALRNIPQLKGHT